MSKKKKLYCYAKANQMVDHRFTDDVAICWAKSKKEAYAKFHASYEYATIKDIFKPYFCRDIAVLTDY